MGVRKSSSDGTGMSGTSSDVEIVRRTKGTLGFGREGNWGRERRVKLSVQVDESQRGWCLTEIAVEYTEFLGGRIQV